MIVAAAQHDESTCQELSFEFEVANAAIYMDKNNDSGKNSKDGKDVSKDDEGYDADGDDDDGEDDDNDDGGDNDDINNNATNSEESDNRKGENDGTGSATGLDERAYAAIDILRNKFGNADIECGVLGLVVPKEVTNKELTKLSFL